MTLVVICGASLAAFLVLIFVYGFGQFEDYHQNPTRKWIIERIFGRMNWLFESMLIDNTRAAVTLGALSLLCMIVPAICSRIILLFVATFLFLRVFLFIRFNSAPFAPVWDADSRKGLRKLMRIFDEQCTKSGLTYVTMDGAVLGYERNRQMIPWDPDIDVVVPPADWINLREMPGVFHAAGLNLDFTHSPHMVIVSLSERPNIYSPVEMRAHNHSWPHIEISELFERDDGKVSVGGKLLERNMVLPPVGRLFEDTEFRFPPDTRNYVIRMFGENWAHSFIPEAYCNRFRFGYSWPKFRTGLPGVSHVTYWVLLIIALVAEAWTPHKGFYILKLTIASLLLAIIPGHFQIIVY